jgi:hypothetical protein
VIQTFTRQQQNECLDAIRRAYPIAIVTALMGGMNDDTPVTDLLGFDAITEVMGDDSKLVHFRLDVTARWTWFDFPTDTVYFKNDVDALLFKMKFL